MKMIGVIVLFFLVGADAKADVFHDFFKNHRILFFFASTCPYCHQQAPILKAWSSHHDAVIEAYSFDGLPLQEFSNIHALNTALVNVAFQGSAIRYPALFIINQQTQAIYPVSIGALSEVELSDRFRQLISKIMAYEGVSS